MSTPSRPRPFAGRERIDASFRERANRWLRRPRPRLYSAVSVYLNGVLLTDVSVSGLRFTKSRPCR